MAEMKTANLAVDDDDDSNWEYEYHKTETEVGALPRAQC